ncbi:hypothetical protein [Clostridium sp. OS1-26]|uniref:hypothetical protein n=1 Tax=Clostridium sp. OS1-26 TaxID=3070681 RepID=UPI0027E1E792|nr:hypothetical protein [Clostridium sp. OS1-26]WML36952.1 hypothetical protein RCG18_10215 [Clostridium sp. OS1-26]
MKKVKTMKNCLGTGKVCCKIRSKYNMLAELLSKIEQLETEEHDGDRVAEVLLDVFATEQAKLAQSIRKTCLKCERAEKVKIAKAKAESDVKVAKQLLSVAEENLKNKMEVLEGFYL